MRTTNKCLTAAGVVVCAACAAAWVDAAAPAPPVTPASSVTPTSTVASIKPDTKNVDAKNAAKGKAPLPAWFTPEREAAALTFVRANHSELADLLDRLKQRRPHEYQKAIRDLFRVSERLTESRERRPERYEAELREWKLQSRIQLLVARLTMGRTPELEQELRGLLNEQLDLRHEIVRQDRDRATARLQALQRDLDDLESRREQLLEERLEKALKSAGSKKQAASAP